MLGIKKRTWAPNSPEVKAMKNKFVITIQPCEVCENPSVEYVNGETCGCEVCHEEYMNQE